MGVIGGLLCSLFIAMIVLSALGIINLIIFAWKDTPDTIKKEPGRDFRHVWGVNRPRVQK